ncbi:MAG: hypothetical protein IK035_04195 [Firmicutes bacterium]|nr:hypothetical protein [Bacillota bacterium]
MGLFDLLGKKSEKEIKNLFSDMEKKIKDAVKDGFKDGIKDESPKPAAAKPAETVSAPAAPAEEERSDALWGELMPKDENQFDFKGTYTEYFEKIFREDFPGCSFTLSHPKYYSSDIYTFTKDGSKALVIELMKKNCSAKALRRETQREGVPYLRFYTDCSDIGWWNARSYVVGRMREALKL